MKSLSLLLTTVLASSAFAIGGSAEGGGNTLVAFSTAEQVSTAIDRAIKKFELDIIDVILTAKKIGTDGNSFYRSQGFATQIGAPARVLDILRGVKSAEELRSYIRATKIEKRVGRSCAAADGTHVEASVQMGNPSSAICFSVDQLRRLPRNLLPSQVEALVAHEFVHKLGYGESDAVLIQTYFLSEIVSGREKQRQSFVTNLQIAIDGAKGLMKSLDQGTWDENCIGGKEVFRALNAASDVAGDRIREDEWSDERMARVDKLAAALKVPLAAKTWLKRDTEREVQYRGYNAGEGYCMHRITAEELKKIVSVIPDAAEKLRQESLPIVFPSGMTQEN